MTAAVLCRCGHADRVHHGDGCRGCGCGELVPATDPDTARARAHGYGVEQQRLISALRRAVAARTWDEALGAVLALQQLDRDHAAAAFADTGHAPARRTPPRRPLDGPLSAERVGAGVIVPTPTLRPSERLLRVQGVVPPDPNETEDEPC